MSRIPYPWHGIEANQTENHVSVKVWGRKAVQDGSLFPVSLATQGQELLYSPIRLTGMANGEAIHWEDEGCYLLEPKPELATVNGYAQSECLICNSTLKWEYDGAARWDVKVMPRGLTVPQIFGLEPCPIQGWHLQKLALEIPLRKEAIQLYVSWPAGGVHSADGTPLSENGTIPKGGLSLPFKPGIWLGNEKLGIQFVMESDALWQPEKPEDAIEIEEGGDHWILRFHLLDNAPKSWKNPDESAPHLNFSFGVMMTPVKPEDPDFLKMRAVHVDCFAKIQGDYWPYLNKPVSETDPRLVIDRLCDAGVNLLILHEKWNKIQNYWEYGVQTKEEITKLVRLCHERGIKVIPYFGYEITSPMPSFAQVQEEVTWMDAEDPRCSSMWYRVPYQRAHKVCYQSRWHEELPKGVLKCIDDFEFDGVYLDSTTAPWGCGNEKHGCGWRDEAGKLHPTYPVFALREMMKAICEGVHERHGIVNPHPSGATFPFITAPVDFLWDGEHIQTAIWKNGLRDFSLDYFRAEYLGKNLGIPVSFIVYEKAGVWSFDMALSISLIHGVYPRPNSVYHPLDVMEKIWNITGRYGIADAAFHGYWEQEAFTAEDGMKVSYYERTENDGSLCLLVYVANPTTAEHTGAELSLRENSFGGKKLVSCYDAMENKAVEGLPREDYVPYAYRVYEMKLR